MTTSYLHLHHGPGTNVEASIIFNHRFSQMIYFNASYLNQSIDDYDLYYLIEEETQSNLSYKKYYLQFVLPQKESHHTQLFEILHFDIEEMGILKVDEKNFKPFNTDSSARLLEEDDQQKWISYIQAQTHSDNELENTQISDLIHLYLKQKPYSVYIVEENNEIIASAILFSGKSMNQVLHFFGEAQDQYTLINSIMETHSSLTLLSEMNTDLSTTYLNHGFKVEEQVTLCTKFL